MLKNCFLFLIFGLQLLQAQTTITVEIGITYDSRGRVETLTHRGTGKVQRYTYNYLTGHSTVTYDNEVIVSATDYWHAGLPESITIAGHGAMPETTISRAYDVLGRATEIKVSAGGVTRYRAFNMTYNDWGFIGSFQRQDPGLTAALSYGYGSHGELRSFTVGGGTVQYSYDPNGNLTTRSGLSSNGLDLNELPTASYDLATNRRNGWAYDLDGNLLEDDNYRYTYNGFGRLSKVSYKDRPDPIASYAYDAFGFRTREIIDNRVIFSARLLNGQLIGQEIRETRADGGTDITRKDFVYHNGFPILMVTHHPDGHRTRLYRYPDRMGHAALVADEANGYAWEYREYSPYGQEMLGADEDVVTHEFTGHERDSRTGWDYMMARYYSWDAGRFNRPDPAFSVLPANPYSYNLYSYAYNNPVNGYDPSGEVPWMLVGAVIGGGSDMIGQLITNGGRFSEVNYWSVGGSAVMGAFGGGALGAGVRAAVAQGGARAGGRFIARQAAEEVIENVVPFPTQLRPKKNVRNPYGSKGKPDHQAKVAELVDKADGELGPGERIFQEKGTRGLKSNRRPDVQIIDQNGKTRKIFEAERKPNSQRNKAREAEYDRLGVEHETHGLKERK